MSNNENRDKQAPTVASIMAILDEVAERLREVSAELKEIAARQKEADRRSKEADKRSKEADKRSKELDAKIDKISEEADKRSKETDRQLRRLGVEIGNVGNQWGKVAEYIVGADFRAILKERFGIEVDFAARKFDGSYKGDYWEIDVAAANGEVAVVGEIKVTMSVKKINAFVTKNLRNFHRYVPDHRHKKIYGLIAFVKIDEGYEEEVLARARECGLLIVRAIGDSFKVLTAAGTELRDYGAGQKN